MGSFKDKSFKPTQKVVIATFESRKEAINAEIFLHNFYEVHLNPHFANKAKQTSTGFCREGMSEEEKAKLSEYAKLRVGKKASMYGKTHSAETRKKLSEFRKTCTGEKNHMYGKRGEKSPIFGIVRDEETRRKISEHAKKCRWWNNGVSLKRCPEQPGPEWQLGMIARRRV